MYTTHDKINHTCRFVFTTQRFPSKNWNKNKFFWSIFSSQFEWNKRLTSAHHASVVVIVVVAVALGISGQFHVVEYIWSNSGAICGNTPADCVYICTDSRIWGGCIWQASDLYPIVEFDVACQIKHGNIVCKSDSIKGGVLFISDYKK